MTKGFKRSLALAAAGTFCLLPLTSSLAAPPAKSEIEQLKQQVQQLMQQNQQLNQRLNEMEKGMQAQPVVDKTAIEEEVARQVKEKSSGPGINEFVSLSGVIEGDYKLGKDFQGDHSSEFVLDTVDLIFDLKVTDWATGKIVVEYDGTEGNEDIYIDEAHVTLGNTESFPFFLTGGKLYVPFGDFSTNMIQDPLTQTLGETNSAGVIAGFEKNGFTATVFSYNGMNEGDDPADEDNDSINGFGASLGYSYEQEEMGFKVGGAWINNIADADNTTDILEDSGIYTLRDQVPGLSLNLGANYKAFSLITEYITALDSFDAGELAYGAPGAEVGAEPAAWNTELAYATAILDKETVFAIGYQRSWEAVALELPEHRYIAATSFGIFDGTTLTFEYFHDEDYSIADGGTDNSGHGFTTRLTYEF
ncbi:LbtU family siderophore porin [Desulfobulbus elongatus]|uniref:LbtU family siderophore porin n=1 Tax=Desulfobulbus elongatus TaxID=53332 RepID=UPI00048609C9|nr:LbtU family siderophore porin [Desulfobulbus elongatus]